MPCPVLMSSETKEASFGPNVDSEFNWMGSCWIEISLRVMFTSVRGSFEQNSSQSIQPKIPFFS